MQADRSYMKNTLVLADLTYENISPPNGKFFNGRNFYLPVSAPATPKVQHELSDQKRLKIFT